MKIFDFSIDVPTLMLTSGMLSVVAAIMLTANWQMNRQVAGTKEWAITQWFWAAGILLYLSRGAWSDWFSIILANMLIILGSFLLLRGFHKYQGTKSTPILIELFVALVLFSGYCFFTFIHNNLHGRVLLLSIFSFFVMLRVLFILWPLLKSKNGTSFVVGFGISLHGLFFLFRAIFTLSSDNNQSMLAGGAGTVWMLLESIVFIFWSTISFALLTNLKLQTDLRSLADKDPLTDLLNRRAVFDEIKSKINLKKINSVSVLVLDLDKFKLVNDRFGHLVGDKVLKHFAYLMSKIVNKPSMVGRTGGEEFIAVLPNYKSAEANEVARKICQSTRDALIVIDNTEVQFTVSIGVAGGEVKEARDLREIINRADKAMYQAKNSGRDCFRHYNEFLE